MKTTNKRLSFLTLILFAGCITVGNGQTFFGAKGGVNATNLSYNNSVYKEFYDTEFDLGFSGGFVFLIENKEKYGLYAEFLYATKGKKVESQTNDYETNEASYQFIEVPIMFRVRFKQPKYSWFVQLGPELNYWLGGNGKFEVYEPDRDELITYEYKVNFGEPENSFDYMNIDEVNRLQLGLGFGGGVIFELKNANFLSLDLRFTYGHSFMGGYESGSIPNIGLVDNFEYTNNVLSVSTVYYFNIMERVRLSKNKYRKRR